MISKSALDDLLSHIELLKNGPTVSEHRIHAAAAGTYAVKRIASCSTFKPGRKKGAKTGALEKSGIKVVKAGGGIRFRGMARCKAHQICPICHGVWLREQRRRLAKIADRWPGQVSMVTLTVRHRRTEPLSDVLKRLQDVRREFADSAEYRAPWISGIVLRLEISLGAEGWHPHLHGLVYSHGVPTTAQAAGLEAAWRAAASAVGCPVGRHAAKLEVKKDRKEAHMATGYLCKLGPSSPLMLLRVIAAGDAPKKVEESAKRLWREYCAGVVARNRMRYVTAAGKEIKDSLALLSKSVKAKEGALSRIHVHVRKMENVSNGEWSLVDLSAIFLERVVTDALERKYSDATRYRIGQLQDRLAEALEYRAEMGFSADFDPYGIADEIERELAEVLVMARLERVDVPALGELTGLGVSMLSRRLDDFAGAQTIADVRTVLKRIIAKSGLSLTPEDFFVPAYENQEINSMTLPGMASRLGREV